MSRRSSSSSLVDSISQDDLIEYFPRTYLPNVEKEIDILNKIKQLKESGRNEVGLEYVNEFRSNKQILFCIITPGTRQIPFSEFKFTFNLYIPSWRAANNYRRNIRRKNHCKYDSYQQIFLKYTFAANHDNIHRIHSTIVYKMNNSGHCYFATKPYPKALPETIRKRRKYGKSAVKPNTYMQSDDLTYVELERDLNDEMETEQKYYKLPDCPKGKPYTYWWRGMKASTQRDLFEYAAYLQIIFNSPSLCIQDFIYDELKFDNDIKHVLQQKAQCQLNALISVAETVQKKTINETKVLLSKQYRTQYNTQFHASKRTRNASKTHSNDDKSASTKPLMGHHRSRSDNITNLNILLNFDYRYHTVYIVSRPISYVALNVVGCNHWALKFEGINHLMTVAFFYDDVSKQSKVNVDIMRNSKINRRIFWYWWPRYVPNEDENDPQFFNTNWKVIDTVYLGTMSTELIGRLILRWLTKYSRYITATNNCQHFVRDMVSVMNIDVARKLPAFFDNKIFAAIIPAAAAAGVMTEEARMLEVADMLSSEIDNYRNIVNDRAERKENEFGDNDSESDTELEKQRSNSIGSTNWNVCAQFIGLLSAENDNTNVCDINNVSEVHNNEHKIEEEQQTMNDILLSDVNSESKDEEKQEMENITPQMDTERNDWSGNGVSTIVDKGLSDTSKLIAQRVSEMNKSQNEMRDMLKNIKEMNLTTKFNNTVAKENSAIRNQDPVCCSFEQDPVYCV